MLKVEVLSWQLDEDKDSLSDNGSWLKPTVKCRHFKVVDKFQVNHYYINTG